MQETQKPETASASQNPRTLKKGDRVIVRNQTLGGESVIEGKATIVAVYPSQGSYRVRFDGDSKDETYIRFLNAADKEEAAQ